MSFNSQRTSHFLPLLAWHGMYNACFGKYSSYHKGTLNCISSFFCTLTYAIIYVLIHHIICWLYLYFLDILYLCKYSCTNILHRRSLCTFYWVRVCLCILIAYSMHHIKPNITYFFSQYLVYLITFGYDIRVLLLLNKYFNYLNMYKSIGFLKCSLVGFTPWQRIQQAVMNHYHPSSPGAGYTVLN